MFWCSDSLDFTFLSELVEAVALRFYTEAYAYVRICVRGRSLICRALVSVGAVGAQHPQISREIHLKAFFSSKTGYFSGNLVN